MKTKLYIAATALLLAGPALAQDAPGTSPTEPPTTEQSPTTTPPPSTAPAPMDRMDNQPSAPMTPPADQKAEVPAPAGGLIIGDLRKSDDDNKTVSQLNATVDKVEDMDIYDTNGKKIAEVESVLEDKNGEIKGLAIEYGGFLGFGSKEAVLTIEKVSPKDGNLVTEITEEQLSALPVWND